MSNGRSQWLVRLVTVLLGAAWASVAGILLYQFVQALARDRSWPEPVWIIVFALALLTLNVATGVGLIVRAKPAWYAAVLFVAFSIVFVMQRASYHRVWNLAVCDKLLLWSLILAYLFLPRVRALFCVGVSPTKTS